MINRRGFLGSALGLGLGIEGQAAASRPSEQKHGEQVPATLPGFEEYERTLAASDQLEALGIPPSWSLVREGFHPLTPERVVIGPPVAWDPHHHRGLAERLKERLSRDATWRNYLLPEENLLLILRLMDLLTTYYRVPDYLERWADLLAKREALGSTGMGHHFGLLHQFQNAGLVRTANPPVDWWLFLFPRGLDYWESLDEKPVHAMLSHVFSTPRIRFSRLEYQVLGLAWQTAGMVHRAISWLDVSRMDRIAAARFVNRAVVQSLSK